jgi:hypothetical protein
LETTTKSQSVIGPPSSPITPLELLSIDARSARERFSCFKRRTEDDLFYIRQQASEAGSLRWLIEVAVDAEIWRRSRAKCGRGNKDETGIGRIKRLQRWANRTGSTVITLYRNIKIYFVLEKMLSPDVIFLGEKGFFAVASNYEKPNLVIAKILKKKRLKPDLRVIDAVALARSFKRNQRVKTEKEDDEVVVSYNHLKGAIKNIREELISKCPNDEIVRRLYEPFIDDLKDEIDQIRHQSDGDKVKSAWEKGYHSESALSKYFNWPRKRVVKVLEQLQLEGEFIVLPSQSIKLGSVNGDRLWHRVGEPLGEQYVSGPRRPPYSED